MIEMYLYLFFVAISFVLSIFTWHWVKTTEKHPVPFKFKTAMILASLVPGVNVLFSLLFIYVLLTETLG